MAEKLGFADLGEEVSLGDGGKLVKITEIKEMGRTTSVLVRGSNQLVIDEAERSLHDVLCVVRCLVNKKFLIAGGGAPEIELSRQLGAWAKVLHGMEGYCVKTFAEALEVIPYTLAENAGFKEIGNRDCIALPLLSDACMGDVVMFEQNVYGLFNIASRGGNSTHCGTQIVTGRIVKESYGAAKQQHTFTIEVLWSKGEKPLPPLHPLLIKGRNLYRLKTLRQKWEDEGERQKILLDKHAIGGAARLNREARIQKKELHKTQKLNRCCYWMCVSI